MRLSAESEGDGAYLKNKNKKQADSINSKEMELNQ